MSSPPIHLLAALELLKIAGEVDEFKKWFGERNGHLPDKNILHGYKYFIEGCFHMIYEELGRGKFAGLKNDFTLDRAYTEWISFEKLDNTCGKIVLLKNIFKYIKPVKRAAGYTQLHGEVKKFHEQVSVPLQIVLQDCLQVKPAYSGQRKKLRQVLVVSTLYLYFNKIANSSPGAHVSFLAGVISRDDKKYKMVFEGYKYAMQFVWVKVLGAKKFNNTSLINLHKADSWKKYIYKRDQRETGIGEIDIFDTEYDPAIQTCLDSHFENIKQQIILPMEKKYKLSILSLEKYWSFNSNRGKRFLRKLLDPTGFINPFKELSVEDKIQAMLYWLPFEVVDYERNASFNGVPAFNTMLAGTVALKKKSSPLKKCIVCKFSHPYQEGSNNYSYAILVDSFSAADHYISGWVVYYDCCNDYSGFSGAEHRTAESLINKYWKDDKLELRELVVDYEAFTHFVAQYLYRENNVLTNNQNEAVERLQKISKSNQQLWNDMKAMMLEWCAYYVYTNNSTASMVRWNIDEKVEEIDVLVEGTERVKLVECKLKPANLDLGKECEKLKKKGNRKGEEYKRPVDLEFWFWHEPSEQHQKILQENGIGLIVMSRLDASGVLKNIRMDKIRMIMQKELLE